MPCHMLGTSAFAASRRVGQGVQGGDAHAVRPNGPFDGWRPLGGATVAVSRQLPSDGAFRVIVADDDPFARRLMSGVLERAGMIVVAEARDGHEAAELGVLHRPDVIVMDVVMPGIDGLRATRRIIKAVPDQLVIMLTSAGEDELGLLALRAGAVGFLSKEFDIDALPRALEGVRAGEAGVSREMTGRLIEQFRNAPSSNSGLRPVKSPLTRREWEVIDLLAAGHSPDAIADALVVSRETVLSHIKNLMRKLGVHSRADAVAAAERLRLTLPDSAG
jgi:NarL family two-component system response regulator LiaR